MGYFDRLRDLATAAASPAARTAPAVEPLEQEAVAVAPPPQATPSRPPEEPEIGVAPARPGEEQSGEGDAVAAGPPSRLASPQHRNEVPEEAGAHRAADSDEVPEILRGPPEAEAIPASAPPRGEPGPPMAEEPRPLDRPESLPAASAAPADTGGEPDRRFHEALVRVRRWLAEPASRPADEAEARGDARLDGPPEPGAPEGPIPPERRRSPRIETPSGASPEAASPPASQIVEERTEVAIGTISVTVEEPDAGSLMRPTGRRGPVPSRGEGAVPRHYLRGW